MSIGMVIAFLFSFIFVNYINGFLMKQRKIVQHPGHGQAPYRPGAGVRDPVRGRGGHPGRTGRGAGPSQAGEPVPAQDAFHARALWVLYLLVRHGPHSGHVLRDAAAGQPEQGPPVQAHRAAPQRQRRGAGAQDPVAHDPSGRPRPGDRLLYRHLHPHRRGRAHALLCGGVSGDRGHLLPVHGGEHLCAQGPAAQQAVLLSDQPLHRRVRYAPPHEAERHGPGQHLHPVHHGDGHALRHPVPVPGHGGYCPCPVSRGRQCGRALLPPAHGGQRGGLDPL